jgi:pyrroloquinoline quinone biosynthesis protein B
MKQLLLFLLLITTSVYAKPLQTVYILGIAQDGGYPHPGCEKQCCRKAWQHARNNKLVTCLAIVDTASKKWWLVEATPDITRQLHLFRQLTHGALPYLPAGIFITHAHIGHYAGLMELGREAMGAKNIPVYTLPRMKKYLETNGPWSQLVQLNNIHLAPLTADTAITVAQGISFTAFTVPHRDEFSETAGFNITAGGKKYLFIPDIDKWSKWNRNITEEVKRVDIAYLDGTFYDSTELPGRNMKEVPHPFISETLNLFTTEPEEVKAKIHFIHFNHTNPVMWRRNFIKAGIGHKINVARQNRR